MKDSNVTLAILNAAQVVRVSDDGQGPRRGQRQSQLDVVEGGAVVVSGDRIVDIGPTAEIERKHDLRNATIVDAAGRIVLPGLVDCHTHPIFGGIRYDEYARRLAGASLKEMSAQGGGIWRTVTHTRLASDEELLATTRAAFHDMLMSGTVTVEAKSGYGQTVDQELRLLRLIDQAAGETSMNVVPTFLGAHVVPREMQSPDDYVSLIIDEMLPAVAEQGIAKFCDVACEVGWFSNESCARILAKGREYGLPGKLHIDAFEPSGGWRVAAEAKAASADHMTVTTDEEIDEVGAIDTVAVLLPTAELYYFSERRANARKLINTGVPVAISTDFCSSIHTPSLLQALPLAAAWFRMAPEEVIVGATLNAAYAIGMDKSVGSIDGGKRADLILIDVPHFQLLTYDWGVSRLSKVIAGGRVVYDRA